MSQEAWRRVQTGGMWGWERRWFVGRAVDPRREEWESYLDFPVRWVAGEAMPVRCRNFASPPGWPIWLGVDPAGRVAGVGEKPTTWVVHSLDTPKRPGIDFTVRAAFDAVCGTVYEAPLSRTCHLVSSAAELFTLDESAHTTEIAWSFLNPRLVSEPDGTVELIVNERNSHPAWERCRTGLGCRIDILLDGRVIGESAFAPAWKDAAGWYSTEIPVRWADEVAGALRAGGSRARIRLIGDPAMSLRSYAEWPFDDPSPTCWAGRVELDAPVRPKESETVRVNSPKRAGVGRMRSGLE